MRYGTSGRRDAGPAIAATFVTVKAGDVGEALEVAADLVEAVAGDAQRGLIVRCDDAVDEAVTELARGGLRPVASRATAGTVI